MKRPIVWCAAAAAVLATLTVPATAAPSIDWAACQPEPGDTPEEIALLPGSECATLKVPIDWNDPAEGTFELAVSRRKAQGQRVGVLVFGPGGPGDSGVDRIRTGMSRFSQRLEDRFDIVSFDPRGVARSNAVKCSAALVARQPSPILKNQRDFDATVDYNRELAADCRENTGPVYDHLDTLQTLRDVDAIRAALGEQQISFHGSSYGTLLGQQYAERYPRRVRALVLESVFDHSAATTGEFLDAQAWAGQDSFDEFVKWCTTATTCALHGQDIHAVWDRLLARAGRGELPDPQRPSYPINAFQLSFVTFRTFYGPDWVKLAGLLAQLDKSAPPTQQPPVPTGLTSFSFVTFCRDFSLPVRDYREYAGHLRRLARDNEDLRYPGQLLAVTTCLGLPKAVNPQRDPKRYDLRTPALLINSLHDPATGYNGAKSVARQFGRDGVLVTYRGWGHGSYTTSPCMEATVDGYLIDRDVPHRGKQCAAVDPTG
ncbi:alpha/beta hydrolase [Kribbella italica]|uniref:Pimeloyl-ACP methyl ester carboxylesterase n=1 Tax=Kribbella italica TaxID=1540520 RepID=A0A7W9JBB9_9ACTN|nr:alpha/beta hydrolase [Kribbella italica]MBB5838647.1 pimeloyl-ACP methyl ester carboxylesterase [Kribbella italica]